MLTLLHSFYPASVLLDFSPLTIHWYGLCLVLAMGAAIFTTLKLSKYYRISKEIALDLAIYLIIGGILGARIYEIFLEFPYYSHNLLATIKIWEGGLAIHGAIIGGIIAALYFAKKNKLSLTYLIALVVPGMAIGQAIGRWGNWFNQELFGLPSNLPWSIPIEIINRPLQYINSTYFHPTFLYESIGSFLIFCLLLFLIYGWRRSLEIKQSKIIIFVYLFSYSVLRFSLEFIKIDQTPMFLGLRWPQIASLIIIIISIVILFSAFKNKNKSESI